MAIARILQHGRPPRPCPSSTYKTSYRLLMLCLQSRVSAPTSTAVPALPLQGGAIRVRSNAATPSWTHAATHQLGQHHERSFQSSSQGLSYNPLHPTDYFPSSCEPLRLPPMESSQPPDAQPSAHHNQSLSPPMAFLAPSLSASSSRSDMGPPAAPPPRSSRRTSPPPMGRLSPSDCVPSSSLPMSSSGWSPDSSQPPSQYATGAASVGRMGTSPQLAPTWPGPAAISGAVFHAPFNETTRIQDSVASYHSSTTATDRPLRPIPSGDERVTAGDPMLASRGRSDSTSLARRSDASASDSPVAPHGSASQSCHAPSTSRTPSSTIASAAIDTHARPSGGRASRRNTAAPVRDDEPATDVPATAAPLARSGSGGYLPSFLQLLASTAPDAPPPPHPTILSSQTTPNSAELGERLSTPNELSLPRPSSRRASEQYAPPDPHSERGLQTGPQTRPARQSSIGQTLSRRSTSSVRDDGPHGSSTRAPPRSAPTTDNPLQHPPRLLSGPGVPAHQLEGVDAGAEHHRGHTVHDAVVSHDRSGNRYVDHSVSGSSVHPQPLRRYDPSADVQVSSVNIALCIFAHRYLSDRPLGRPQPLVAALGL